MTISDFYGPQYADLLADSPAFCLETADDLTRFVGQRIGQGADQPEVEAILRGPYCPSKKLLDHVATSIQGCEPWHLLDEKLEVYAEILADVERAQQTGKKRIIIVSSGPGTGKSVIALQVVGTAAQKGYRVVHATGSRAFTTNIRGIVGRAKRTGAWKIPGPGGIARSGFPILSK